MNHESAPIGYPGVLWLAVPAALAAQSVCVECEYYTSGEGDLHRFNEYGVYMATQGTGFHGSYQPGSCYSGTHNHTNQCSMTDEPRGIRPEWR